MFGSNVLNSIHKQCRVVHDTHWMTHIDDVDDATFSLNHFLHHHGYCVTKNDANNVLVEVWSC